MLYRLLYGVALFASTGSLVFAATIPNVPLFVSISAPPNVMIDMSVTTSLGGAAYAGQKGNPPACTGRTLISGHEVETCFFPTHRYLGIFDPDKCYSYNYSNSRFEPEGAVSSDHTCTGTGKWSGNFLNWATMTVADIFIWTMTGGYRVVDSEDETVLGRARAYNDTSQFPIKYIADASGYTPWSGGLIITRDDENGYQIKAGTTFETSGDRGSYNVWVKVCDPQKGLEANCKGYTNSSGATVYKPVGLIQRYADRMRFGVFAYTKDDSPSRDGGVLRVPMRYVGDTALDDDGKKIRNTDSEINPLTGQILNPSDALAKPKPGVLNYINRFHWDGYRPYDPIGEMFYEVIRYFKKLSPTPEYADGAPSGSFPIYTTWNDPIQFSCQKNFVVAINDASPSLDKRLPGTFFTCNKAGDPGMPSSFTANDCGPPNNPDTSIDVSDLTRQVGQMEELHTTWTQNNSTGSDTVGYVYGITENVGSCSGSKLVADLSRVMGSCPHPEKQNSYYIAGLAYYANTTDLRTDTNGLPGMQTLNSFFIDTQEYNTNPLSGNRNMLWLAGKYGGFTDLNGNARPDLAAEWDADGDGEPDNYAPSTDPNKIVTGLERFFNNALGNVLNTLGSGGNVSTNSSSITSDTNVFQALFTSGIWSGDIVAEPVTSSGVGTTPLWKASEHIPGPGDRKIWFRGENGTQLFQWNNLSVSEKTAIGSQDILNYLRGERSKEIRHEGGTFRNRALDNVLGDIVHSSPYYVKDTKTLYVGANDGMLHAFDAKTGRELFAFIPSAVLPKLKNLSQPNYTHDYYVDGDIAVSRRGDTSNKNYLVAALGRGGKGLFALDVTSPKTFSASGFLWEYSPSDDVDLGYMLGRPIIAKMNNGQWAVIVGNGYNSTNGKAVLYILRLTDGALLKKIDTQTGGDNGLATPAVYDRDGDGDVDVIYAGDLKGNVWKFDISQSDSNQWDVAFKSGTTPQPWFTARDALGDAQPITAPLKVVKNDVTSDPNVGKIFVFFGTGSYFRTDDPRDTQVQSWYGLIDENVRITGRGELKQRSIEREGTFAGMAVRTFAEASANDMSGKRGWYIDFSRQAGERIVTASKYYRLPQPALVVSSIIPDTDPCQPGGNGYVNAINPFTGGRLTHGVFDLNNNNNFSDDKLDNVYIGGFGPGVGMPSEPIVVGNLLVVGGSAGRIKDVPLPRLSKVGRISWREIKQ